MAERRRQKKEAEHKAEASFDLGLGGIFKGLGDFLDALSNFTEAGEREYARTGEFKVKGLGEKGQGVYGFSVRTGIGGIPHVERFGNIRAGEEGPVVAEVREPLVDIFDEDGEILVVAEIPGVSEEEIEVEAKDDVLSLETTGERKYEKEILLPGPVSAKKMEKTFKNGILELRLKKRAEHGSRG